MKARLKVQVAREDADELFFEVFWIDRDGTPPRHGQARMEEPGDSQSYEDPGSPRVRMVMLVPSLPKKSCPASRVLLMDTTCTLFPVLAPGVIWAHNCRPEER